MVPSPLVLIRASPGPVSATADATPAARGPVRAWSSSRLEQLQVPEAKGLGGSGPCPRLVPAGEFGDERVPHRCASPAPMMAVARRRLEGGHAAGRPVPGIAPGHQDSRSAAPAASSLPGIAQRGCRVPGSCGAPSRSFTTWTWSVHYVEARHAKGFWQEGLTLLHTAGRAPTWPRQARPACAIVFSRHPLPASSAVRWDEAGHAPPAPEFRTSSP